MSFSATTRTLATRAGIHAPRFLDRLVRLIDRRIETAIVRRSRVRANRRSASEIRWTRSGNRSWVATASDRFLGMVEEVDGCYVANDTAAGTYNTYRTLSEAMEAFESGGHAPRR